MKFWTIIVLSTGASLLLVRTWSFQPQDEAVLNAAMLSGAIVGLVNWTIFQVLRKLS